LINNTEPYREIIITFLLFTSMSLDSILGSLFVLFVLLLTQYPSVPGGDGGELISEACLGGIGHPPGYPLFTLLSSIAIKIGRTVEMSLQFILDQDDFGAVVVSPARSVNTLCCILAAIACYCISESISLQLDAFDIGLTKKDSKDVLHSVSGVIGGILFTLSPLTWEYSRMAEVFALNNMLISLIIYQTVCFGVLVTSGSKFDKMVSCSMKGAFISGLAMSNQHTALLFILPIATYVIVMLTRMLPQDNKIDTLLSTLGKLALCFIGGLVPYLYMAISSQSPTPGTWGDQTTLSGFFRHILRAEYGSFSLAGGEFSEIEGLLTRLCSYIKNTFKQVTAFGMYLSYQGCLYSAQNVSVSGTSTLLFFTLLHYLLLWNGLFSNLPLSNPMSFEVQSRFYIQSNILICFFIGIGASLFLSKIVSNRMMISTTSYFYRCALFLVIGACISRQHIVNQWRDPSTSIIIHDYANAILKSLPQRSLLLSYSDLNWNSIRYLQTCENKRNDVTHVSLQLIPYPWFAQKQSQLYPSITFPHIFPDVSTDKTTQGYSKYLTNFLKANIESSAYDGGMYIEMQAILNTDIRTGGLLYDEFTLIPWGLLFRVLPKSKEKNFIHQIKKWQPKSLHRMTRIRRNLGHHNVSMIREGTWESAAMSVFWDMQYQLGLHILGTALTLPKLIKKDNSLISEYIQSLRDSSNLLVEVDQTNDLYEGIVR